MENSIDNAIETIDDYINLIYRDYFTAIDKVRDMVEVVQNSVMPFIDQIDFYNKKGEEIQEEFILKQLENLLEGIKFNDPIAIADALKYGIEEILMTYKELVIIYGK